jgi:adenine-specific DNA-methyltransferase
MVVLLLILVVVDLAIKFGREKKHYEYNPHLDPQLTWAGKKEGTSFDIDTVSVHIHERISTQAILKSALRKQEWIQTTLNMFAEPEL